MYELEEHTMIFLFYVKLNNGVIHYYQTLQLPTREASTC